MINIELTFNTAVGIGETATTAFSGDKGKVAYDHALTKVGNPHRVTKNDLGLSNVDNTSDVDKPISTAIQEVLNEKANASDVYTKAEVNAISNSVFHYKNTIQYEADLPLQGNAIGDVYNVLESGANFVWDGAEWDKLSETIDLSSYATKQELQESLAQKQQVGNYATREELDAKAENSDINLLQNQVDNLSLQKANKTELSDELSLKADKSTVNSAFAALDVQLSQKASISSLEQGLNTKVANNQLGVAFGVATLNENGKLTDEQVPELLDSVVEYETVSDFPQQGISNRIYIATSTDKIYRWSNDADTYINIGGGNSEAGEQSYINATLIGGWNSNGERTLNFDIHGLDNIKETGIYYVKVISSIDVNYQNSFACILKVTNNKDIRTDEIMICVQELYIPILTTNENDYIVMRNDLVRVFAYRNDSQPSSWSSWNDLIEKNLINTIQGFGVLSEGFQQSISEISSRVETLETTTGTPAPTAKTGDVVLDDLSTIAIERYLADPTCIGTKQVEGIVCDPVKKTYINVLFASEKYYVWNNDRRYATSSTKNIRYNSISSGQENQIWNRLTDEPEQGLATDFPLQQYFPGEYTLKQYDSPYFVPAYNEIVPFYNDIFYTEIDGDISIFYKVRETLGRHTEDWLYMVAQISTPSNTYGKELNIKGEKISANNLQTTGLCPLMGIYLTDGGNE